MTAKLVIYHAGCNDGFTAAWVAYRKFGEGNVELHPAAYGDTPPDVTGREVYVLDFSYPRDVMIQMAEDAGSLLVLDHHKTAVEKCVDLDFCCFDITRSGAGMTWDWFFPGEPRPWLVNAVEDRDLWKFQNRGTREVHAYLSAMKMALQSWSGASAEPFERVVSAGTWVLLSNRRYCEKVAEAGALKLELWGRVAVACNAGYVNGSDLAHYLLETSPWADFSITYYLNKDDEWVYSLRSRQSGDVDVSVFAKERGGGGHRNAAGFTQHETRPPWALVDVK